MSMLTPPGMGGKKFRVTGDRYPRMRPRRRRGRFAFLTVAALATAGLLGYGTLQLIDVFSADDDGGRAPRAQAGPRPDQDCAPPANDERAPEAADVPEPSAITVNVYNATGRTGLAQDTADALAERGFTIGDVANAPQDLDGQVQAPGLLLGETAAEESGALTVLGAQLEGAETGAPRPAAEAADPASVVDLVIGEGFTELTAADEADRRLAAATVPTGNTPAC
ncbi:LytR C-terminal domain-containing protein [Streptomyces sp. MP131-18]|uniref:LytR C-terminal domain-containing protein n=1 Tax=Streptomyces sp. MP131-18 TaxID=1857892 RepID=UPI00097C4F23|nr:LytR C-terminal domain-containing protein [Streptomyces sp. MP131-18]